MDKPREMMYNRYYINFKEIFKVKHTTSALKRLTALLLAVVMTLAIVGCGATTSAMSFGQVKITSNMYCYWMSKYKAMYLYSMFGTTTDNAQYWSAQMTDTITVGDYLGAMAASQIMQNAILLGLFEEYDLTVSDDTLKEIDNAMEEKITQAGSKSALNSALSPYGINSNMLKEIYIAEAKISAVQDYLYGENGIDAASEADIEKYYSENYYRCKHILIRTDVKYEYDENGDPVINDEGTAYKTITLTADEIEAQKELAADLEKRIAAGEDYDELVLEYSEDTGMQHFEDGYYITSACTFLPTEITSAVMKMNVGETKTVETSYGISIVRRYELIDGAYNTEPYKSELIGDIGSTVNAVRLQTLVAGYADSVILNNDVISDYPLASCTANFYY